MKENSFQTEACAHVNFTLFSFNEDCTVKLSAVLLL